MNTQKKRGRPKKVKPDESRLQKDSTVISNHIDNEHLLFETSLQPQTKVQLSPESAIIPSKHDKPFLVSIFASNQKFRKSIE